MKRLLDLCLKPVHSNAAVWVTMGYGFALSKLDGFWLYIALLTWIACMGILALAQMWREDF